MRHGFGRHIPLFVSADLARESLLRMEGANDEDIRHFVPSIARFPPGQQGSGAGGNSTSRAWRHGLGTHQGMGQTPEPTRLALLRS